MKTNVFNTMKLMVMISIDKFTICVKNIEFMVMICQLYFNIFHWNLLFHHISWLLLWNVVWDTCLTFLLFTCGYQPILSQCSFLCPLTMSEKRIPDYFREYRNRSLGYFYPFPFYLRLLITTYCNSKCENNILKFHLCRFKQ